MNLRIFDSDEDLVAGLAEAIRAALASEIRPRIVTTLPEQLNETLHALLSDLGAEWIRDPAGAHAELLVALWKRGVIAASAPRWFIVAGSDAELDQEEAFRLLEEAPEETSIWWFITRDRWQRLGGLNRPLSSGTDA
ncbi:MAG: hypothetical protein KY459_04790 [Acidobacteria bacterium]|nr:hypothetical protein [Acidobacteriota bacterium]